MRKVDFWDWEDSYTPEQETQVQRDRGIPTGQL